MTFGKKYRNFLFLYALVYLLLLPGTAARPPVCPGQDLPAIQTQEPGHADRCLVIDPGHGGKDSGAAFGTSLSEKTLTLSIAQKLKELIEADTSLNTGLKVLLTRAGDNDVPLDERAAIANHHKAELLLSIHFSSHLYPAVEELQIFIADYSPEELEYFAIAVDSWTSMQSRHLAESQTLAQNIEKAARESMAFKAVNFLKAPVYVLEGASMAAVEVEAGFVPTQENIRKLESEEYQWQIARVLFQGIMNYLTQGQEQAEEHDSGQEKEE
ncbi:MAG: N-acetylmuramoyl-L-alanine amidase [bacterium]